ncbi:unnamed protein product [Blepharisma stoltei]|uniref:Response regulatory domain-containing protein n=1 Tax=Blepharisma stoltei TaxID=1481888 RepID=A0AAU9IL27_9CILI|nr:unnamed protein product [Blepharisma stoltei]
MLLGNLLKQNNIYYEEACTGIGATKKVKKKNDMNRPFKVIALDGRMPDLNGWDASRAIIKMYFDGEINALPAMIGYTALSSEADIKICLESGMQECLVKPCNRRH